MPVIKSWIRPCSEIELKLTHRTRVRLRVRLCKGVRLRVRLCKGVRLRVRLCKGGRCTSLQLFTTGVGTAEDLALDWVSQLIYWTDYTFETINVGTTDGRWRSVLFGNNVTNPRSIVLDNSPRSVTLDIMRLWLVIDATGTKISNFMVIVCFPAMKVLHNF